MTELFSDLLVTTPNGGGFWAVADGAIALLDDRPSTGLSIDQSVICRGIQPNKLILSRNSSDRELAANESLHFNDIHDVLIVDNYVYLVSAGTNEILQLDFSFKLVRRWTFRGGEDSWHLNCLGLWAGEVVFSAFGKFNGYRAWEGKTRGNGFVQRLSTNEILIENLSQPHSLLSVGRECYIANSGEMELLVFRDGNLCGNRQFDGYVRGACEKNGILYIGLSCSRNIANQNIRLNSAAVVAVDRIGLKEIGRLYLPTPEIYEVKCMTGCDSLIRGRARI